ncbi:MAG: DUF3048 domain-containing protein [Chloroflexi bacterium]|nr:DUF3048 domain-containing protein [Chloroflexota bacterium]
MRGLTRWYNTLIVLLAIVLVLSACGGGSEPTVIPTRTPRPTFTYAPLSTSTPVPTPTMTATPTPTTNPYYNPLSGQLVTDPAVLSRRPLHVRIGNDPQIRQWQAGLSQAEVVYEDIMDGWWDTRLTAVFLSEDPEALGPVRSARLVNLELAPQYDAALVHSGASDQIRWLISQSTIVDLDEFFHPRPYYYVQGRDWRGRLFTSAEAVRKELVTMGKEGPVALKGFVFSPQLPAGDAASYIRIPYPKAAIVEYRYDRESGRYMRYVQGEPHIDDNTDQAVGVENVIVQYVEHQATDIVEDSLGNTAIRIVLTGQGPVQIFRDGVVISGIWRRDKETDFTQYLDADGNPIPLKPGHTWVQLVPPDYKIEYKAE